MKIRKYMAIALAATLLALVGCGNKNDSSSVSDVPASTEATTESAETTTTAVEATTAEKVDTTTTAPPSPFADGIETPIDGVRLGMRADDITAMFGEPSYKSEMGDAYYYNTDSVTAFGETYNADSSIELLFDDEGYLSVVTFNLGGQFKDDGQFERIGTYSAEQQKADFDKLYAIICEKAGEPTHKNNWGDKKSCYTWTSDDLETNPTEYFIDEGAVDGLYANYVSFYIIADTSSNKMPFYSLLPKEPVKVTETTIAEATEPDESAGDSMAFADMADAIDKAMSAHANDPADTADDMLKLCRATIEDLKANGLPLGEYTGDAEADGLDENGESAHEWEDGSASALVCKMPTSTLSVSDIEGITLKDANSFKMISTDVNGTIYGYSVTLRFNVGDPEDMIANHKACENIFSYFVENGYVDAESSAYNIPINAALHTEILTHLNRDNCGVTVKNDKFKISILPDTANGVCDISFYKL